MPVPVEVDLRGLCMALALALVVHLAIARWLRKPNLASPTPEQTLASPVIAQAQAASSDPQAAAPPSTALDDPSNTRESPSNLSDPSDPREPIAAAATATAEATDATLPTPSTPRTPAGQVDVLREGWCTKEGGRVKSWKRRYIVLRTRTSATAQLNQFPQQETPMTHVLLYYKSQEQAHDPKSPPTGVIPIHPPGAGTAVAVVVRKNKPCVRIQSTGHTDRSGTDRSHFMVPEGGVAESQAWMDVLTTLAPAQPRAAETPAAAATDAARSSGGDIARASTADDLEGLPSDQAIIENLTRRSRAAWVPDKNVKVCMVCSSSQFTMRQRKHHCRNCGKVVCGACSNFKAVLDRLRPERVCKVCYKLLDAKASRSSKSSGEQHGDVSEGQSSDDDEYCLVSIDAAAGATSGSVAEAAVTAAGVTAAPVADVEDLPQDTSMAPILDTLVAPPPDTSAAPPLDASVAPPPDTFAGRWGSVLTESLRASMALRTEAGADEFDVVINDPAMRVSRATGVLGGVKIDKNKTEAIFDGITAKELCDYFYSLERKLDWEMVVDSVALIEDGDAALNATVYHLKMKRTWPAAQRTCALITQLHKVGDGQWLAHSDTVEHTDFARAPKDLRVKSAMFTTTIVRDGAVPPYARADVKCRVEYFAQVNPGGFAPPSVVSAVSRREFPKTLKSLRDNAALWFADKPVDNN